MLMRAIRHCRQRWNRFQFREKVRQARLTAIAAIRSVGGLSYPTVHTAVVKEFCSSTPRANDFIRLYPVNLDVKQTEIVANLFDDGERAGLSATLDPGVVPVFELRNPRTEEAFCTNQPPLSILLDLNDLPWNDFLAISPSMWWAIRRRQLRVIYLKLQVDDPVNYAALNPHPDLVTVLSVPMLLGGSRFHITLESDYVGDARFRLNFQANPHPDYRYDWSWVGAETSPSRAAAFRVLDPLDHSQAFYRVSRKGHVDSNQATVPYQEYLAVSRSSRVCVSLNGNGPWCLKDGELLTRQCFVLRQHHGVLGINPLTPKAGVHWAVAPTDDLPGAIAHYVHSPEERERIRLAGYDYFRAALIERAWARAYVDRLVEYVRTPDRRAWGPFLLG